MPNPGCDVHEAGISLTYPLVHSMLDFVKEPQDAGAHNG
jgi:hypothetical protein